MTSLARLHRGFLTVGIWTFLSRITGFLRDIVIAALFGSGPIAEAFQVAFALPNLFRRLFAEGTVNTAFVPMLARRIEAWERPEVFVRDALSGLAGLLVVLVLLAQAAMPWFVLAMASGFSDDGRLDLAVDFGRICFPYILFISLAALLGGVLNALGRFAAAAAAPVLLNVILLAAVGFAVATGRDPAPALVWGVPLAGIAQLVLVWTAVRNAGFRVFPGVPRLSPDIRRLGIIALPAVLAGGVVQINIVVGRQVASYFDGAIQWLAMADRLYQLPLGVVGIAIGVVLLPDLARKLRSGNEEGGRDAFNRATEFSLALTLPAAFALVAIPAPLVSVLFERGAFTAADSAATAAALAVYGMGLPSFVLQKTLQPLYFAREDTRTPFRYAVVAMAVNAVLAVCLMPVAGYLAAAIGTTLSGWVMVALLWRGSRTLGPSARIDARLRRFIPRALAASAIMAGVIYAMATLLGTALAAPGVRYVALAVLVGAGMGAYFAAAVLMRAVAPSELRSLLRR